MDESTGRFFLFTSVFVCIPLVVLSTIKTFIVNVNGYTILYYTTVNQYLNKTIVNNNLTIIESIVDDYALLNPMYFGFVYFLMFMLITWWRFAMNMSRSWRCCKPREWYAVAYKIKRKMSRKYTEIEEMEDEEKNWLDYMNLPRFLYQPTLVLFISTINGITDIYFLSMITVLSFAMETMTIFVNRDIVAILIYLITYLYIWFVNIFASTRFPNKLLVVTCAIGMFLSVVQSMYLSDYVSDMFPKMLPILIEFAFNILLGATGFVGNFY